MVVLGVVIFATASALCGATPTGSLDEAWLIVFRVIQGAGAAIMFPAALAIVLGAFPVRERGRAMAIFFADRRRPHLDRPDRRRLPDRVDLAGDLLGQHPGRDHRPVLTAKAKPDNEQAPGAARLPRHGADLRRHGPGRARPAAVERLGLGQRHDLGLHRRRPRACSPPSSSTSCGSPEPADADADLRGPRLRGRQRRPLPADDPLRPALLLRQHVRADLARRKRLGNRPLPADLLRRLRHRLAVGRQDARPGRGPAAGGARLRGRRGRLLPLGQLADRLSVSDQWYYIVLAGVGVGLVLSPANTDALNRVPRKPLRRGDRDHPDGAQLRLQPRPRGARHDPDPAEQVEPRGDADRPRACRRRPPTKSPTAISQGGGQLRKRRQNSRAGERPEGRRRDPPRLRARLAHRLLRDGRGDGGRLRRSPWQRCRAAKSKSRSREPAAAAARLKRSPALVRSPG